MKLLLTSNGITNQSIRRALESLMDKGVGQARVVLVPTAIYAMPDGGTYAWQDLQEHAKLGWKTVSMLELTAIPSMDRQHWMPLLEEADAILIGGGNTPYLSFWLQQSGLADELPRLVKTKVYVGIAQGAWLQRKRSMSIGQH